MLEELFSYAKEKGSNKLLRAAYGIMTEYEFEASWFEKHGKSNEEAMKKVPEALYRAIKGVGFPQELAICLKGKAIDDLNNRVDKEFSNVFIFNNKKK